MSKRSVQAEQQKFFCLLCEDLLGDPTTLPCGHSFCLICVQQRWDGDEQKSVCPQCRKTFVPRPVLVRNAILADLVEELKKTGLPASTRPPYAGPGDVTCDLCTGRKLKASKSCLQCLASYCRLHLLPHYEAPPLRDHKLVEASANLQENVWSCRQKVQQRIRDRERDVKLLQQEAEAIDTAAERAVNDSRAALSRLQRLLEARSGEVQQHIRTQQQTEGRRARQLLQRLQTEVDELRGKDGELEQLSCSEDHAHFLLCYPSVSRLCESSESPAANVRPLRYFEEVTAAVSDLAGKLQDVLSRETNRISAAEVDVLLTPAEPKTRAEFLKYSRPITLDPNTVNRKLQLSEGNRKVSWGKKVQSYPDHPDRFADRPQVLSAEGLTGRSYWEVRWSESLSVAVAYKDISRTGSKSGFGHNNKSWALYCLNDEFIHNSISTPLTVPHSPRVGVYLNHRAGILSFYSVNDTMTLLHRVHAAFSQPLHVGLFVGLQSSAELLHQQ
ncbi:E3 ubiquitin/ISG15 ligase TRIM25-like [Brachyistius frenatus]|uniref:E3 ubiquitin/ISG15 ligase TRIM25-like n=1 Tax=Brachyistius frenatus TaxID=100188 RepID=UPI0037E7DB87